MDTLNDVTQEVSRQLNRDYSHLESNERLVMCVAGLAEEAGEVNGILKRTIRNEPRDEAAQTIQNWTLELGDVLWYLTAICVEMGISLQYVWDQNCKKLEERYHE